MTTGIYTDYGNYYNPYGTNNNYSPYGTNTYTTQTQDVSFNTTPSTKKKKKDLDINDGKIGFWKAAGNFVKGGIKFFTGMVTDNEGHFSLGKTLKTALTVAGIGAACVLTAGTAIPALIAAGGVAAAGIGMGASVIKIATAKTDADAEAAWQSLGANTTAAGIAVAGARAVAKSAHPTMAKELEGPKGFWNGTKQVFKDSADAIGNSASGIGKAVKGGVGLEGKFKAGKNEVVNQFKQTKNKVVDNFNKSVYDIKGKVAEKSENIGKEIDAKKAERAKMKEGSEQAKALDKEIARLEKKQTSINEVNDAQSWGQANSKIQANRRALVDKEAALEKATTAKEKAQISEEIADLKSVIKEQESVLSRRTSEVTRINERISEQDAKIEKLNKSLEKAKDTKKIDSIQKEIAEVQKVREDLITKQANAKFEVPEYKVEEYYTTEAEMTFNRTQNAVNEAQTRLNNEKIELGKIDKTKNPTEYSAQEAKVKQAQTDLIDATANHKKSQLSINSDNAHNAVADGQGSFIHAPREIAIDAVKNPAARWLTIGAAGKQTGYGQTNNFYNYLSDTEKAYYNSLSPQEQAALIATYNQYV